MASSPININLFGSHALAGLMIVMGAWLSISGRNGNVLVFLGVISSIILIIHDMYLREERLKIARRR